MPKTNRKRTQHRKRISQQKRRNASIKRRLRDTQGRGPLTHIYYKLIYRRGPRNIVVTTVDLTTDNEYDMLNKKAEMFDNWWKENKHFLENRVLTKMGSELRQRSTRGFTYSVDSYKNGSINDPIIVIFQEKYDESDYDTDGLSGPPLPKRLIPSEW